MGGFASVTNRAAPGQAAEFGGWAVVGAPLSVSQEAPRSASIPVRSRGNRRFKAAVAQMDG
jgi:hypothetical protein